MNSATTAMLLLLAVVLSGFLGRLVRGIPLPLVQIAFGAGLTWCIGGAIPLEPDFFLFFFIPPLLFADARRYPKREFKRLWRMISAMAMNLVVFTVVGAGFFIDWLIPSMPLPVAFALAAVLSPTDPVAVSAITANTRAPRILMHLLEGEALLNDASGLVCLRFAVAAMLTGQFSVIDATGSFLFVALGGVLVGGSLTWAIGFVQSLLVRRGGEVPGTQILVTILQPFAAYLAAEHLHVSGILAAVSAGLMLPLIELHDAGLPETRLSGDAVWGMLQFALNGAIFVLLGEQIPGILAGSQQVLAESRTTSLWTLGGYVVAITVALTFIRFVWLLLSVVAGKLRARREGRSWRPPTLRMVAAGSVAGVRGAVTLVGVLTLPLTMSDGTTPFPTRSVAIFLACGVILMSLIAASALLPFLFKNLESPDPEEEPEDDRTRFHLANIAATHVQLVRHDERSDGEREIYIEATHRIAAAYRHLQYPNVLDLDALALERARKLQRAERELRIVGLRAARDELLRMRRHHELSDESTTRLMREIDLIEIQLAEPVH